MPARSVCGLPASFESRRIFTGRRWTTFTQLPVAFSGGSSENRAPVPAALATCALYADLRRFYAAPARQRKSSSERFVFSGRRLPAGRALRSLVEREPGRANTELRIRSPAGALGSDDHALVRLHLLGLVLA